MSVSWFRTEHKDDYWHGHNNISSFVIFSLTSVDCSQNARLVVSSWHNWKIVKYTRRVSLTCRAFFRISNSNTTFLTNSFSKLFRSIILQANCSVSRRVETATTVRDWDPEPRRVSVSLYSVPYDKYVRYSLAIPYSYIVITRVAV